MNTMTKVRKMITIQKLSFIMSCVALAFSVVAFMVANKANYGSMEYEINRSFQPIGNTQEVEIVKADGSVEKLSAVKSKDKLGELINNEKQDQGSNQQNSNGIGINNDNVKQENKINKINKGIIDKTVIVRPLSVAQKQEQKVAKSTSKAKSSKTQSLTPVERQNKRVKIENTAKANAQQQNTAIEQKSKEEKAQQPDLIKGIVVQIGSFKEKTSAEKLCQKMTSKLEGKKCKVGSFGNLFASLIIPFKDVNEAKMFDKNVLNKQGIYGYIKNNG